MKLPQILEAIEAVQDETQTHIDGLLDNVQSIIKMQEKLNNLISLLDAAQGTNEAKARVTPTEDAETKLQRLNKLLKTIEVSENAEQLKKYECNHPHWEESPQQMLIVKTCSTCGAQKYE